MDTGGDKPKKLTMRELAAAQRRNIAKRRVDKDEAGDPLLHLERIFEEEDYFKSFKNVKKRRNKRNRSKLRFYKHSYGFKAPLQLLVDESFVKRVFTNNIHRIDRARHMIARFLGEKCEFVATSCTVDYLREQSSGYNIAHLLKVVRCGHSKRPVTVDCLEMTLKNNDNNKFILATVDTKVLRTFMRTPALPIVFAKCDSWALMGPRKKEKDEQYQLRHIVCECNGSEVCGMEACVYARAKGLAV